MPLRPPSGHTHTYSTHVALFVGIYSTVSIGLSDRQRWELLQNAVICITVQIFFFPHIAGAAFHFTVCIPVPENVTNKS